MSPLSSAWLSETKQGSHCPVSSLYMVNSWHPMTDLQRSNMSCSTRRLWRVYSCVMVFVRRSIGCMVSSSCTIISSSSIPSVDDATLQRYIYGRPYLSIHFSQKPSVHVSIEYCISYPPNPLLHLNSIFSEFPHIKVCVGLKT